MIGDSNQGCEIVEATRFVRGDRPEKIRTASQCSGPLRPTRTEGSLAHHSKIPGGTREAQFWSFSLCQRHRVVTLEPELVETASPLAPVLELEAAEPRSSPAASEGA